MVAWMLLEAVGRQPSHKVIAAAPDPSIRRTALPSHAPSSPSPPLPSAQHHTERCRPTYPSPPNPCCSRVIWLSVSDPAKGFAVDFASISMHAVMSDPQSVERPCLYLQLDVGSDDEEGFEGGEEDEEGEEGAEEQAPAGLLPELRLVPALAMQRERGARGRGGVRAAGGAGSALHWVPPEQSVCFTAVLGVPAALNVPHGPLGAPACMRDWGPGCSVRFSSCSASLIALPPLFPSSTGAPPSPSCCACLAAARSG